MEDQQSVYYESQESFFNRPMSLTLCFCLASLLFLLPFVQLKCASVTLAQNNGLGLATGKEWKVSTKGWGDEIEKKIEESVSSAKKELKTKPNIFAILALGTGLMGFIFSLVQNQFRPIFSLSAGILGAVMLFALMIQLRSVMRAPGTSGSEMGMLIKVKFTIWYWASLFCFASAAWLGYRHHRNELEDKLRGMHDFEFEKDSNEQGNTNSSGYPNQVS